MSKINRNYLALCLTILLMLAVSVPGITLKNAERPKTKSTHQINNSLSQKREFIKRNFEPDSLLLRDKGVPFDPEVLLEKDWSKKLASAFDQMPEMYEVRYQAEPLRGVELADTLYLPEQVEVVEDTVILARHLIFEGNNVLIKGNHRISIFPAEDVGVMGTTLPRRMSKTEGKRNREMVVDIPETIPPTKSGRITIDTSGIGWKEWLESIGGEEKLRRLKRNLYSRDKRIRDRAKQEFDSLRLGRSGKTEAKNLPSIIIEDTSGAGAMGAMGAPGTLAAPANPAVQPKAAGGVCGGDINGKEGVLGASGGTAGAAGTGGTGNTGGNGTGGNYFIPDGDTNVWSFKSRGGQGGMGGPGGFAHPGAPGGKGGDGGDGADCPCNQGGTGNGGKGGTGGTGGTGGGGGDGGKGGKGGNGGTITLNAPCRQNWTGSYSSDINPGGGG